MDDGPKLLRVSEVARELNLGRTKVYEMVTSGELPSLVIGRSRRIPRELLDRWMAAKIAGADATADSLGRR